MDGRARGRAVGIVLGVLALAATAALGAASALGGGVGVTLDAVRSPDLLAEPRAFAGVVAGAGVLAGGVGVALAIASSLLAPRRREEEVDAAAVRVERALARRRVASLAGHVVVCGDDELVRIVGDELGRCGVPAVVVVEDHARADRVRLFLSHVIAGDPKEEGVLRAAGVERAAALALCGVRERERLRVAAAARRVDPDAAVAAVHDAAGARLFAEALVRGETGRPLR